MSWKVPFFDLDLGEDEKRAVMAVLDSNWLTGGPRIAEFEATFASGLGEGSHCVAVSSATAALHLSLLALGIGPGDEVILPSLTFVACANVVRYVGATPVFADVTSDDDWNLSVSDAGDKITPRTRAIMVVHYAGYPCDLDGFAALARERNLQLVEDCSHAPLATWRGRMVGTFGRTGAFSFYSNKNVTMGEGGLVATRDADLADRLRSLRSHGMTSSAYERYSRHAQGYDVTAVGFNYRLDEMRAALGLAQLRRLQSYRAARKDRVARYRGLLAQRLPHVRAPFAGREDGAAFHIFPVLLPGGATHRNRVLAAMRERGIECSVHYRPIHTFAAYKAVKADVPVTERIGDSVLTLPLFPGLTDAQMDVVIDTLADCLPRESGNDRR